MNVPPFLLCTLALLAVGSPLIAGTPLKAAAPKIEGLAELQELRNTTKSPAEKVALTDAWLKAHPQAARARVGNIPSFEARMAALAERPVIKPDPTAGDRVGQSERAEVRRVWRETVSSAKTPQEAIALTDKFLQLNAEAISDLARKRLSAEERRERLLQINAEHPAKPGDTRGEIAEALREIRAQARTPAEIVALTDEFVRLNATTLAEIRRTSRQNIPR